MIVLHPKYINEIKSHPNLSFDEANKKVRVFTCETSRVLIVQAFSAGKYPGFEAFEGFDKDKDHIMLDVINKKLTQALGKMIPLSGSPVRC